HGKRVRRPAVYGRCVMPVKERSRNWSDHETTKPRNHEKQMPRRLEGTKDRKLARGSTRGAKRRRGAGSGRERVGLRSNRLVHGRFPSRVEACYAGPRVEPIDT